MESLDIQLIQFSLIILVMMISFIFEIVPMEVTALCTLGLLLVFNIITVEVHISDINDRQEFRKISVISPVCIGQISGLGKNSYLEGLKLLIRENI